MALADFKKDLTSSRNYKTYLRRIGFSLVTSISLDGHMKNLVEKTPDKNVKNHG